MSLHPRPTRRPSPIPPWLVTGLLLLVVVVGAQQQTASQKHATAVPREGALAVDGELDDAAWRQAPVHTGFEMPLGTASRRPIADDEQTFFQVVYDDAAIYFGVRCNEPKLDKMTTLAARQHDAAMWSDDDVELFIDPVGDRTEYYQLAINSDGTQVDLYLIESGNTGKDGWSSEWKAATHKGEGFWSLEVAVPFGLFHNRPSRTWSENWVFSISRTRTPAPRYYSQFSPAEGYHDVAQFGTLGPINVDRDRFNLYAGNPSFRLEPAEEGFAVSASLTVENRGEKAFEGSLEMALLAPDSRGATAPVSLAPNSTTVVELSGAFVAREGKWPSIVRAVGAAGGRALNIRFDSWFRHEPITLRLTQPNYRNCIYATQDIDEIQGVVSFGLPVEQVRGLTARVTLSGSHSAPSSADLPVEGAEVTFALPAADLPVGEYVVRAELLRPLGDPQAKPAKFERVAEGEIALRKLPPAPVVEARVDTEGNLLINGQPLFVRGWYGSMAYMVGMAAFPRARLPHSTNFMMGASEFERTDMSLYSLSGLTRLVEEAKAKLYEPIDGELRAKVREALAKVRMDRNIIGYYISDEPECRGLSEYFLKSLRDFIAQEDPYRFCMIVSRAPAQYMAACDVMCPHPYMNPMNREGKREFGGALNHIHKVIQEAVGANDGSKAVWAMPQTFTYGGLYGQNPTFTESRWFAHTALANGAKGMVPFIFNGYWGHVENRVAMDAVFEELAFLAPVWCAPDSTRDVSADSPGIDVIAKYYKPRPQDSQGHTFIVAANQSYEPASATINAPVLAQNRNERLLVLRENRVVAVTDGVFTDEFEGLGVHIYTTLEALPDLETLVELQAKIAAALKRPADEGNILASGEVNWCIGEWGGAFQSDSDLADGVTNATAWLPFYSDRTQCVICFEEPVSFSRVVVHTPTIKSADLDIWVDGAWKTIHQWQDEYLQRLEYAGPTVTTDRVRIRPTAQRLGYGSWVMVEITELGIYP